jgi:prevent-host-death family protein
MKVKVADLKNNLSYYLRRVRDEHERIEVCVRDEPTALLVPVETPDNEEPRLRKELAATGLAMTPPTRPGQTLPNITPAMAADGDTGCSSVVEMRREKDW